MANPGKDNPKALMEKNTSKLSANAKVFSPSSSKSLPKPPQEWLNNDQRCQQPNILPQPNVAAYTANFPPIQPLLSATQYSHLRFPFQVTPQNFQPQPMLGPIQYPNRYANYTYQNLYNQTFPVTAPEASKKKEGKKPKTHANNAQNQQQTSGIVPEAASSKKKERREKKERKSKAKVVPNNNGLNIDPTKPFKLLMRSLDKQADPKSAQSNNVPNSPSKLNSSGQSEGSFSSKNNSSGYSAASSSSAPRPNQKRLGAQLLVYERPELYRYNDQCWNKGNADWFARFESKYLDSKKSIIDVVENYRIDDFSQLYTIIEKYFEHMKYNLDNDNVQNYFFEYQERVFDFYSTGQRFIELLDLPGLLTARKRQDFGKLLETYDSKLSQGVKAIRKSLMEIRTKILEDTNKKEFGTFTFKTKNENGAPFWWRKDYSLMVDAVDTVLDPEVFSFRVKKSDDIEKLLKSFQSPEEKLKVAIQEVGLSSSSQANLNSIVDCLQKIIDRSELKQFQPELHMFGSIASGLGTYDSDIDLYIKFAAVDDIVAEDFFTAVLLLNNLLLILHRDMGVAFFGDCLVFSQRCPILKLGFGKCFPNLQRRFKDMKEFDRRLSKYKPKGSKSGKADKLKKEKEKLFFGPGRKLQDSSDKATTEDAGSEASDAEGDEEEDEHEAHPSDPEPASKGPVNHGELEIMQKVIGSAFNSCDISLKNMFGVYNSKFIAHLCKYDQRFYEMALLIKFWAKELNIIGRTRITSYGMTMLVIYFLQQQSPPIIPPIQKFLDLAKLQGKPEIVLQGNHFEFCDDIDLIGRSENKSTTFELLVGFFRFYADFDFFHQAICTRSGQPITRAELYETKKAADPSTSFTFDTLVCIEDPFVTYHNCGRNFRSNPMFHFYSTFDRMARKITTENCVEMLVRSKGFKCVNGDFVHLPMAMMFQRLDLQPAIPRLVAKEKPSKVNFFKEVKRVNTLVERILTIILCDNLGLSPEDKGRLFDIVEHDGQISMLMDNEFLVYLFRDRETRFLASKCSRRPHFRRTAEDFKEPTKMLKQLSIRLRRGRGARINQQLVGNVYGEVFRITWHHLRGNHVPIFNTEPVLLSKEDKSSKERIRNFASILHFFINETFYRMDSFNGATCCNEFIEELFEPLF